MLVLGVGDGFMEFGVLGFKDNEIGILLYQSEAD